MELVVKDLTLFQSIADRENVPLDLSPLLLDIFKDGQERYGGNEWSPNIVRRLEDACVDRLLAPGFPADIIDSEPEIVGEEVVPRKG